MSECRFATEPMKNSFIKSSIILGSLFIFFPFWAFADCKNVGYTTVYVNGIFTPSKDLVKKDQRLLEDNFSQYSHFKDVKFVTGYNPSHLAGAGDLIQVVFEMLGGSISDYDLKNILFNI